jgi:bifunctional DNA-binding transcriptional regulator/antitoxin component of YhaV-PrlF toxin-antitoxin module
MAIAADPRTTVRLRPKNQLTLPEAVARAIGAKVGDRFFISAEEPDRLVLERVPASFEGSMADVWPDLGQALEDLRTSRDEWDEHERRQLGR